MTIINVFRLARLRVTALAMVSAAILAACTSAVSTQTSALPPGTLVSDFKDFPISVYQGETVMQFSDLFAQGKPVILNFWAALCPPCRAEMLDIQAVDEEYRDRVIIFGLDIGPFVGLGSREDGKALIRELKVTYSAGTTSDSRTVQVYRLLGMPTTVFLKPDGQVVRTWTGLLTKPKLAELTNELIVASGG